MIRVGVVSPRPGVRQGITAALSAAEVTVIGEADAMGESDLDWDAVDVVIIDVWVLASSHRQPRRHQAGVDSGNALQAAWSGPLERITLLTLRERDVFDLIGDGLSNHAIASCLGMAERTVKSHVGRILTKLDVDSRLQVGLVATANRLTWQVTSALGGPN